MRTLVHRLGMPHVPDQDYLLRFRAELEGDLNFPRALALAWELLKSGLPDGVKKATILSFDEAFGLGLALWQPVVIDIPPALVELMTRRERARSERRWLDADRLRAQARDMGFELDDTPQGQQARRV